jgi:hypothetical protein
MEDDFYAAVKGLRLRLLAELPSLIENDIMVWDAIFVDTFKVFNLPESMLSTMGTSTAYAVLAYSELHGDGHIDDYVHRLIRGLSWHLRSLLKLDSPPMES